MRYITVFEDSYPDYASRIDTLVRMYEYDRGDWRVTFSIEENTLRQDERRGAYTEKTFYNVVHKAEDVLALLEEQEGRRSRTLGSARYEYLNFTFEDDLITRIYVENGCAKVHLYKGTLINRMRRVMEGQR